MTTLTSPFAKPAATLPIREGAPQLNRPTKEEVEAFPAEAQALLESNWRAQKPLAESGQYDLNWLEGRHILLGGGTGPGLGGALATAILGVGKAASVTIVSRDLKRSINFETGLIMESQAEAQGLGRRFHWFNDGLALEGAPLEKLLNALREAGADRVVYFNTTTAALSGMLPGMPPVYVKDVAEDGLFQWKLLPLDARAIEVTKFVMGEMAAQLPRVLEDNGVGVEATIFADWRGSLDKIGRDPGQREYGRQGSYSTSLYLPKDIIQEATRMAYDSDRLVMDIFYPMMRTRALPLIPGGMTMANVMDKLMKKEGVRRVEIPELAIRALDCVGRALTEGYDNPFPRLDSHEAPLDEWFYEVMARLNNEENSEFYYQRWM